MKTCTMTDEDLRQLDQQLDEVRSLLSAIGSALGGYQIPEEWIYDSRMNAEAIVAEVAERQAIGAALKREATKK